LVTIRIEKGMVGVITAGRELRESTLTAIRAGAMKAARNPGGAIVIRWEFDCQDDEAAELLGCLRTAAAARRITNGELADELMKAAYEVGKAMGPT
jgi:hypothetical protein